MNSRPGHRILQDSQKTSRWGRSASFFLYGAVVVQGLLFAQSFAQSPEDALSLAATQMRAGLYDKAIAIASQGLRSRPSDYRLMIVEGLAYSMKHDDPNALRLFGSALRISPNYLPALRQRPRS